MIVANNSKTGVCTLAQKVFDSVHESVTRCYQCGKCSAGCPLSDLMDFPPSRVLRMLQYEQPEIDDMVLGSQSVWLCLTCETCVARCPQEVDLPKIMDVLRSESLRQKKSHAAARDIIAFHKSFLDTVKLTGRSYEVGLVAGYKMRTMHLLQDVASVPKLLFSGKLNLLPHMLKSRSEVANLFTKTLDKNEPNGT